MNEGEIRKLIRDILRKELAQTMMATIDSGLIPNDVYLSAIQRFSTDAVISGLRLIQPYGFACAPPQGTECLIGGINSDPSHLIVFGQFDSGNRPDLGDGETTNYGPMGQISGYCDSSGNINFGTYVAETGTILPNNLMQINTLTGMVTIGFPAPHGVGLGDIIEMRLSALESALATLTSVFGTVHTHEVISLGSPTGPPVPPADPFVPVPTPVASLTVMVST